MKAPIYNPLCAMQHGYPNSMGGMWANFIVGEGNTMTLCVKAFRQNLHTTNNVASAFESIIGINELLVCTSLYREYQRVLLE